MKDLLSGAIDKSDYSTNIIACPELPAADPREARVAKGMGRKDAAGEIAAKETAPLLPVTGRQKGQGEK
jgi:hypothetical protein